MSAAKIGHGHELVVVARSGELPPRYLTDNSDWTVDPARAKLFQRAANAHRAASACWGAQGAGWRIQAEGICTPAFGQGA